MNRKDRVRCSWVTDDPLYVRYHDEEWGRPVHDDRKLFEFIVLEGAQAGLSWLTVLRKRENYRRLFFNFDPKKVAKMGPSQTERALADPGVVRNRLKIESVVPNAQAFLSIQKEFKTFDAYVWSFAPAAKKRSGRPRTRSTSRESDALSGDLKKRGFKFVGSTICYAFMQACGLVDDHAPNCFRSRR